MWLSLHCGVRVRSLAGQPERWLTYLAHPVVPIRPWEQQRLVTGLWRGGQMVSRFGLTQELDEKLEKNRRPLG